MEKERVCVCVCMSGQVQHDSAGSMIDNCTGFESPDLETRTVAEGERETGRGKGWGNVCVCVGGGSEPATGDQ